MPHPGDGNPSAHLLLVGEAWGPNEERLKASFIGASGDELNRQLHEVGILRNEVYTTNLVNARPPYQNLDLWIPKKKKDVTPDMVQLRGRFVKPIVRDGLHQLLREIHLVKPNLIVTLGAASLWALTGAVGVQKWRGSQLHTSLDRTMYPQSFLGPTDEPWKGMLIPTLHPAYVLRDSESRAIVMEDWRRIKRFMGMQEYGNQPNWKFNVRPSISSVLSCLAGLAESLAGGVRWLDFDLETRAGHIACAGLSWSREEAICIPFMCLEDREGYWLPEEEAQIIWLLFKILTHPNARIRGQNLLYDAQYTWRHWHFVPRVAQDTMISHHSAFAGLPKRLDFQASMYCDYYVQWKPDKETWKQGG